MSKLNWETLLSPRRSRESSTQNPRDIRTEFRKDYHRIVGSASFRRLQDKTQVFPLDRGDFVRTRLTHSMEVSSFADSLADTAFTALIEQGHSEITEQMRESCCDILQCAGLVHDIGNPPFGHFGEFTIREWFGKNLPYLKYCGKPVTELLTRQQTGDFLSFEGNAQALRVLSKLHYLVDENGMNLNFALLNTVIKYPVSSLGINRKSGNIKDKKMGYYCTEQALFREIIAATGAVDCRYPLTFLLEAADDIAYKTADIEDAVKKKMLTADMLLKELLSDRATEKCGDGQKINALRAAADKLLHCLRRANEREMPNPDENAVSNWIVRMQSLMIGSAADSFVRNYDRIMEGEMTRELLAESDCSALADMLGDIAYRYAFTSKEILKIEISVGTMVEYLLERFTGAALRFDTEAETIHDKKLISVISDNYLKICRRACEGADEGGCAYARLMLVTDFLCGMTDGYARELYREITGIA